MTTRKRTGWVTLFHFTPKKNLPSIKKHGINPRYSRGKYARVWLVGKSQWKWALFHVAQWNEVHPTKLFCFTVRVPRESVKRIRPGVYVTYTILSLDSVVCYSDIDW